MRIRKILSQHRRDFIAIYFCEHCGYEKESNGYDDEYFHSIVIPTMVCESCGEEGHISDYTPMKTKYDEGYQI